MKNIELKLLSVIVVLSVVAVGFLLHEASTVATSVRSLVVF